MKTIGFIDYYLDEWHANSYIDMIAASCKRIGDSYKVAYAWAEIDSPKEAGKTTDEWCSGFNVERCKTIKELCDKSDYIMILAPSDPDKHLIYAAEAFKCGKRMYVDKTFAPDVTEAEQIYGLAQKYGVSFFSTSALRYASEISGAGNYVKAEIEGGGSNFDEYVIHLAEMAVKTLGTGASSVTVNMSQKGETVACLTYDNGKYAEMKFKQGYPFKIALTDNCGNVTVKDITSDFFATLMDKILTFFNSGKIDFDKSETLEVMRIRGAAVKAAKNKGVAVKI